MSNDPDRDKRSDFDNDRHPEGLLRPEPEGSEPPTPQHLRREIERRRRDGERAPGTRSPTHPCANMEG